MPDVSDAIISLEAPLRAGDVVWSQDHHASVTIAVVDEETGLIHIDGAFSTSLLDSRRITRQKRCTDAQHAAALKLWARVGGSDPRGVVARRQLHRLWSDGKIGREPKT